MTVYVFDSSPFIDIFRHYYPTRFPSLWEEFHEMTSTGRITSTREVRNELEGYGDSLSEWCKQNGQLFPTPTPDELNWVRSIFEVRHFQAVIRRKESMSGKPIADPFVIGRASTLPDSCVVTAEKLKPNAAQIPNICEHLGVNWTNLEGFMERESWSF